MNDDLTILASAYLDGEATPEQRAQVDGDAELTAEVERLRQVRAVLAADDDDGAPISVRERHLAAALDAWDRLPDAERAGDRELTAIDGDGAAAAGAASVTAPTPLANRRQRKNERANTGRLLTAAAALVLVLGGGLVVRGVIDGSGSDDAVSEPASEAAASSDESVDADDERLSVRDQLVEAAAEETFAEDSADAAEAPPLPAADALPVDDGALGLDDGPRPEVDLDVLSSDESLRVFASDALPDRAASGSTSAVDTESEAEPTETAEADQDSSADTDAAPPTTVQPITPAFFDCDGLVDIIVGPALWDPDGGIFVEEFIVVGIDTARNEAVAYSEETCDVIARTSLDTP